MAVNLNKHPKKSRKSGLIEVLNNFSRRIQRVSFSKTVRKRYITPLKDKPLNSVRLPDDLSERESNSFIEVTDSSVILSPVKLSVNPHWKTINFKMVESPTRNHLLKFFKAGNARRKAMKEAATFTPWVDAFVIRHAEDILSGIDWQMLKDWMISWSKKLDMLQMKGPPVKKRKKVVDDDVYVEEVVKFDEMTNTFIVHGPTGCGKTSIVKYCAKKANFDVLELSVSDLRSASVLKKTLSGAIENFAVRGANDIRSLFQKATGPQRKMIILIDDADVIFQVDNNFWSKLNALRVESKVPIVLTCTDERNVLNNLVPADCRTLQFYARPPTSITEHLLYWFRGYTELNLDEDFVFDVVCEAKQDIRKAVNMLQFYAGSTCYSQKSSKCIENPLSSTDLAELDTNIGICYRLRDELPVKWTAKIAQNLDFGNDADGKEKLQKTEIENNIFPASSFNDVIIRDAAELVYKRKPKIFEEFDENSNNKASKLKQTRNFDASVPVAVFDCWKRKEIPSRPDTLATDELFLFQKIDDAFNAKIGKKPLGRRVLHPFSAVDLNLGYCLDINGNLKSSIREFSDWPEYDLETDENNTGE